MEETKVGPKTILQPSHNPLIAHLVCFTVDFKAV